MAQNEAIKKDLQENSVYKQKLLKRIQVVEQELKDFDMEHITEPLSIVSESDRSRPSQKSKANLDSRPASNFVSEPLLSQAVIPFHNQNEILKGLNVLHQKKLDVLRNKLYDKSELKSSLRHFIDGDCIEYKEYGIEAFEILSLHLKLLEITLSEKTLLYEIETRQNLGSMPILKQQNIDRGNEVQELAKVLKRQIDVSLCPNQRLSVSTKWRQTGLLLRRPSRLRRTDPRT